MNPHQAYTPLEDVSSLIFFIWWQYLTDVKTLSKLLNIYKCDFIVTRFSLNRVDFIIWESMISIPHSIALKGFESVLSVVRKRSMYTSVQEYEGFNAQI